MTVQSWKGWQCMILITWNFYSLNFSRAKWWLSTEYSHNQPGHKPTLKTLETTAIGFMFSFLHSLCLELKILDWKLKNKNHFKLSKNVEWKTLNDPRKGWNVKWNKRLTINVMNWKIWHLSVQIQHKLENINPLFLLFCNLLFCIH